MRQKRLISSCYTGQFQSMVPSVGSRLSSAVSPSYGKARIIVRHPEKYNLVRQNNTGQWIGGRVDAQDADTNALNPRRLSRSQRKREKAYKKFLALRGGLGFANRPRLVKP